MEPDKQPAHQGGQLAVGLISLLLMIFGAFLALTDDVALGAALLAIGAAITPSVAWWRRDRAGG
jgi:hypothetical protein